MKRIILIFNCILFLGFTQAQNWYSHTTSLLTFQKQAMDLEIFNETKIFFGMNDGYSTYAFARIKKFSNMSAYSMDYNSAGTLKYTGPDVTGSYINAGVRGISFPTASNGWGIWNNSVTNRVNIVQSTDAGETWTLQGTQTGSARDIKFFDNSNGIILLENSVLKTTNGGNTWTSYTVTGASELNKFHFVDNNTGWAVGNNNMASNYQGQIFKTIDGGNTWTLQYTSTTSNTKLNRIFMVNSTTGWAVGNAGSIIKTTDGGVTWTAQTSSFAGDFKGVYFINANKGWAVGTNNSIAETSNGGTDWTVSQIPNGVADTYVDIDFQGNTGIILDNYGGTLKYCPANTNTVSISECYNPNGIIWGNQFIYQSGQYTHTYQTSTYCDSVVTADFTIIQPATSTVDVTHCGAMYFAPNGNGYNTSGQFPMEVIPGGAASGCDSVVVLNLTLLPALSTNSLLVDWDGTTLTLSNLSTPATGETLQWIDCETGTPIQGASTASFSPVQSGQYALVLSNGSCSDTSECIDACMASITSNGTTLTASTDLPGASFLWVDCSTEELIAGEVSQSFTPSASGNYAVYVINSDETCDVMTECLTFTVGGTSVGLDENTSETFTLFPNPASGSVTLDNVTIGAVFKLTDMAGKILFESVITSKQMNVDVSKLNNGIYFIQIVSNSNVKGSQKLVVNK